MSRWFCVTGATTVRRRLSSLLDVVNAGNLSQNTFSFISIEVERPFFKHTKSVKSRNLPRSWRFAPPFNLVISIQSLHGMCRGGNITVL